ncbi:MAG: hypothetical protein KBA61_15935 [Spirochaetes bacterium]|nr:hypothetical protein [Spirochaetota bacterium]
MELKSSVELLSPEDTDIIKNRYEKPNMKLAVFTALFLGGASFASYHMESPVPIVSTVVVFGIVAACYIWVKRRSKNQVDTGKKNVFTGILEKKRLGECGMEATENFSASSHTFCYFTVSGREFMIPADAYDTFQEGDTIQLHATMPDDDVFRVTSG